MPNRDGTGPWSQGPLTGRGFGPCRGGLGFRRRFWQKSWTKEEETQSLEQEAKILKEELQEIEKELKRK